MSAADAETRKGGWRLTLAVMAAELRVFLRQPVMIALTLLLPVGLIAITSLTVKSGGPEVWAQTAGRNAVATQCITVYFVALNTVTARRHTLALKRLRSTALTGPGIVVGLLTPPILVGFLQWVVVLVGLVVLGAPTPQAPGLIIVSGVLGIVVAALAGVATSGFTATPEKAQWTMLPLFVAAMGAIAVLPLAETGIANLGLRLIPLVAGGHVTTTAWGPGVPEALGVVVDLTVMVGWAVGLTVLCCRTFRWERRH